MNRQIVPVVFRRLKFRQQVFAVGICQFRSEGLQLFQIEIQKMQNFPLVGQADVLPHDWGGGGDPRNIPESSRRDGL